MACRGTRGRRSRRSGPLRIGVVLTCQVWPRSPEWKTRGLDVAAGSEEGIASTNGGDALPAGREGELTGSAGGSCVEHAPALAPRCSWRGSGIGRSTGSERASPVAVVEERHAVVEGVRVVVQEHECPGSPPLVVL